MKVASWKRLHMFQPHLCELQVECWEGEQDSELDSWQLGSNLRSVEVIQGLRGDWYECANCPIRDGAFGDEESPYWDLYGDHAFRKLPSDITGWAVLGELQGLYGPCQPT